MSEPAVAIERRDTDALSKILGTGDVQLMLERSERNVKAVIEVARAKGFVQRYGGSQHEFFGFPAWSLLALTYGLVPFVEWTRKIENGWEARAVVRTQDGEEIAAAEAMCTREETIRRKADEHTLRAMAQTRAMRNALRSCLGAALVLSGFDFADPEGPATREQVGMLHQLERELDWSHEQGHAEAGEVESYKDLTREEASVLIERWTALRDERSDAVSHFPASDTGELGSSSDVGSAPGPSATATGEGRTTEASGAPQLDTLWHQAIAAGLTTKKAVPFAKASGIKVNQAYELDAEQMKVLLAKWRERK